MVPSGERQILSKVLGADWAETIISHCQATSDGLAKSKMALEQMQTVVAKVAKFLGLPVPRNPAEK
jgi:hypothetical protein